MDLLLLGSLALFGGLLSLTGLFDHHSDPEPEPNPEPATHGTPGDDFLPARPASCTAGAVMI